MLAVRMMQCKLRGEVEVRWQEKVEKEVKCFRCWRVGYQKQECPNIGAERERRGKEKAAYVARLQKVQQERRPVHPIWEKVQEYYDKQSMLPEGALLLNKGWIIEEVVATYVDCEGCEGKGVQTHENQEQGFLPKRQVKNMWCDPCQEVWNWRDGEARRGKMTRVQYTECGKRDAMRERVSEQERREILCPECRTGKKKSWQDWRVAVCPIEGKAQQSGIQAEVLKSTAKEKNK